MIRRFLDWPVLFFLRALGLTAGAAAEDLPKFDLAEIRETLMKNVADGQSFQNAKEAARAYELRTRGKVLEALREFMKPEKLEPPVWSGKPPSAPMPTTSRTTRAA